MAFGGYRTVWIIVMFDLPTDTKRARKDYTKFRKHIMQDGFIMMQFSVYARHCASEENAYVHSGRVRESLPPEGEVRIITITDKQFGRMQIFYGKKRKKLERAPQQITLF
ncbi:MAG: CRISPR-associated endonuclease Cas2 [Candidatus Mycalebacterium zealandia]|nr:MAG: CRISPR-associated endonuclease Cas2 [Candidatus Mycalebacterium zealandia]